MLRKSANLLKMALVVCAAGLFPKVSSPFAQWVSPDTQLFNRSGEIASLPLEVLDQGPHHQTVCAKNAKGDIVSKYTELIVGGFRQLEDGSWARCNNEIELFNGGAVARNM